MTDRQNQIACFKNNKKEKDTHPDYRLVGDFEGTRIKGAFWLKKDKNGNTYMSGKLERDEGEQRQQETAPAQTAPFDDDVPW